MATRTDEPLTVHGGLEGDDARKAEEIRTDIAERRNHMARTVDAIEERLSPRNIKAQVSSVKQHLIAEIKDAKSTLKGEVQNELTSVKGKVQDEIESVKGKVREATVGRVENMVSGAKNTMTYAGSTTVDTVKTNPIPAALVAVGLGWLIVSGMKSRRTSVDARIRARSIDGIDDDGYAYSYDQGVARENLESSSYGRDDYFERPRGRGPRRVIDRGRRAVSNAVSNVGSTASNVGSSVSSGVSNVGSKVSNVGHEVAGRAKEVANSVAERAEHLSHDASNLAHDAGHRVQMVARNAGVKGRRVVRRAGAGARRIEQGAAREMRENPIAFGAVAVAIGAAIGLLLPSTEAEDRLVGEHKDRLLDSAKDAAQQAISTFQDKAGELTSNLKSGLEQSSSQESSKPEQGYSNGYSNGLSKQNGLSGSKHY